MTGVSKDLWQPGHFADICTMDRKSIGSTSGGNLPYLGLDLVESQTGEILAFSDEAPVGNSFLFGPQHVLYGKLRPYLNKVAVPDCSGKCSTELVPLLPRNGVDRDYLAHALRCQRVVNSVMEKNTGARMPRTDMKYLMSLPLLIPPLDEQRRIVDILKRADSIRRLRKQALETTRELIPALFVDIFGDPATNPRGWEIRPLGKIVAGLEGGKNIQAGEDSPTNPFRILKVSAVTSGYFRPEEAKPAPDDYRPPAHHVVHKGDLLFSRANTVELVGATALVEADYPNLLLPDKLWRFVWLKPSPVLSAYLQHFLQSRHVRQVLGQLATGTSDSMRNISQAKLKTLPMPVPPLKRQQEFEGKCSDVRAVIAQQEYHLAQAEALRQSLMAQFFN